MACVFVGRKGKRDRSTKVGRKGMWYFSSSFFCSFKHRNQSIGINTPAPQKRRPCFLPIFQISLNSLPIHKFFSEKDIHKHVN